MGLRARFTLTVVLVSSDPHGRSASFQIVHRLVFSCVFNGTLWAPLCAVQ